MKENTLNVCLRVFKQKKKKNTHDSDCLQNVPLFDSVTRFKAYLFKRSNHSYYKELVRKPANFKGTNKDQKIYVGRSTTLHNLLFCAHTLWLNYVTVAFLLVSSPGTNYDLLCLSRVMAKKANKNIEQRILLSFLTIYLY